LSWSIIIHHQSFDYMHTSRGVFETGHFHYIRTSVTLTLTLEWVIQYTVVYH